MGLTYSVDRVDENGREMLTYGTPDFPVAFFDDDLTKVAVPPHWHEEFELVVIKNGTVRMRIAGDSFLLTAGEGYFTNHGVLHAAALQSKTGRQHCLVFSPRLISQGKDLVWKSYVAPVLENPRLPYIHLSPSVPWQKELLCHIEEAWEYGAYDRQDFPIQVRYHLSQSFSLIAANAAQIEDGLHYTDRYHQDEIRIKKALLFIERNYSEDITIDAIADSAGVSVSTCLRLFRSVLGTTPVRYLIGYRLEKSAEEIRKSDGRTMAEIAYSCGFSEASYFNRCFRREFSMTPSEYLSRHREEESSLGEA